MIKKTKRILPVLALALALITGMSWSVFADSPRYDWSCKYNGSKITSDFSSKEIAEAISNLQPGDDVTFNVVYENSTSESTDWYMENRIFQTLEKTKAAKKVKGTGSAENGGYTYELIHYNKNNEETILFSNDEVGGEYKLGKKEGLEPATNALDEWFYIDTLEQNESGKVVLHVAFDGETEVNDYMDTDGELHVRFAVEKTPKGTTPPPSRKIIKTGDESRLLMWAAIGVAAGLLMLILAFFSRKKDEKTASGKGGRA